MSSRRKSQRGDPPRRLLLRAAALLGAVPALLRDPGRRTPAGSSPGSTAARRRRAGAARRWSPGGRRRRRPAAGAAAACRPSGARRNAIHRPSGDQAGALSRGAVGQRPRRRGAGGVHQPQPGAVLVGVEVGPAHRDDGTGAVRGEGGLAGRPEQGEIGGLHAADASNPARAIRRVDVVLHLRRPRRSAGRWPARQRPNRSLARKLRSCASTESHSTSSTNRLGDSTPRVIRIERQPRRAGDLVPAPGGTPRRRRPPHPA